MPTAVMFDMTALADRTATARQVSPGSRRWRFVANGERPAMMQNATPADLHGW
jgi:hypothetical protein